MTGEAMEQERPMLGTRDSNSTRALNTRLSYLDKQVSVRPNSGPRVVEQRGRWFPVMLIGLYYLSLWPPPITRMVNLRWYMALGLSIGAFLLHRRGIHIKAARIYCIVYGLGFLGAVLSLLNATDTELAFRNTAGSALSFVVYLLFVPVLASRAARRFLLTWIVAIGIVWCFEVQRLTATHEVLVYSTFAKTGCDKNHVGFLMSLTATALFYLAALWKPSGTMRKWQVSALRMALGLGCLLLLYSISVIYARGSMLATFMGVGCVLVVAYLKSPNRWRGVFRVGIAIPILFVAVAWLLPRVLDTSPYWMVMWEKMQEDPRGALYNREIVIRKGLFLVSENPLIGIGMGGTKAAVSSDYEDFPHYYIHNSFLTDWAEKGVLGLLSNLVWIYVYLKILRRRFSISPLTDQIWLLLSAIVFFNMNFMDCTSINMAMLAILSAMDYEQYQIEQRRVTFISPRRVEV